MNRSTSGDSSDVHDLERVDEYVSDRKNMRVSTVTKLATVGAINRFGKHLRDAYMALIDLGRERLLFKRKRYEVERTKRGLERADRKEELSAASNVELYK